MSAHDPVRGFTRGFATVWLVHDLVDLALGGTASILDPAGDGLGAWPLVQAIVLACGASIVAGVAPRPCLLLAGAARGGFALTVYPLNDFVYHAVVCAWLALEHPARWTAIRDDGAGPASERARRLLRLQHAWIYLATALLKLNADFVAGVHLEVRLSHAVLDGWIFAPVARLVLAHVPLGLLAIATVGAELALAILYAVDVPRRRLLAVAALVHVPAAILVDVWAFGAAMLVSAWYLGRPDHATG